MKNSEIKEITDAMVEKQSWIRKSLTDFVDNVWMKITEDKISGHRYFKIKKGDFDYDVMEYDIYLTRGSHYIQGSHPESPDFDFDNDSVLSVNDMSMSTVKTIIENISNDLPKYFQSIKKDIDVLSESGKKINNLIEKLS